MGYLQSASTLTLTAKLTPLGRKKLVSNNNALIKTFSLGDSDANYYATNILGSGQVPGLGGDIGPFSSLSNSTTQTIGLRSVLMVNTSGALYKPVAPQSYTILSDIKNIGVTTASGSNITQAIVDRSNNSTDSLVNLFYSFGLSLDANGDSLFSGVTFANGGFSDTALSGLGVSKILVIAIDNSKYGECLDGKTLKINIPTSGGPYVVYSTYQGATTSLATLDASFSEPSNTLNRFGSNVSVLVSDDVLKPNGGDPSLSWATGYGTNKPFSLNQKQPYNLQTNSNLGVVADSAIGLAYLEKGFIVITNQTIVNDYVGGAIDITFDSISTNVSQSITCIADRGEFGSTTNQTFQLNDVPRITEVGLYDSDSNLIAIAKTDKQVTKNVNEFLALSIIISL
jgi:hypothetical protein